MRYFEVIENGYILAVGQGNGHIEIDENRYNTTLSVIRSKPTRTETTDYRLKLDLTWEEYEVPPEPEPEPELDNTNPPDNLDASIEYLVGGNIVDFLAEESSPDYLNEHEHEFNYFE